MPANEKRRYMMTSDFRQYRRIYRHKILTLSNQISCYIPKCIRIAFGHNVCWKHMQMVKAQVRLQTQTVTGPKVELILSDSEIVVLSPRHVKPRLRLSEIGSSVSDALLMSTHNICFYGEIRKHIFWILLVRCYDI